MANAITALRLVLIPAFFYFLVSPISIHHTIALVLFVLAITTDLMDGYVARNIGRITSLGKIIDPIADWMLILATLAGLVFLQEIPLWVLVILVMRDTLLGLSYLILRYLNKPIVKVNLYGKISSGYIMIALGGMLFQLVYLNKGVMSSLFYLGVVLYVSSGMLYSVQEVFVLFADRRREVEDGTKK